MEVTELHAIDISDKMIGIVNSWKEYLSSVRDWNDLVKGVSPLKTPCGPVYELVNPINRLNESFAIADMRNVSFSTPHYHTVETEIYFVLEGCGLVVVGEKEEFIQKESVVIIPSNIAHFVIPKNNLVLAVVNIPQFRAENCHVLHEDNKTVKFNKSQFDKLKPF